MRLGLIRCNVLYTSDHLARNPEIRMKLLEGLPDEPIVLFQRGWTLRHLWREDEAVGCFERAARGQDAAVVDALRLHWEAERADSE